MFSELRASGSLWCQIGTTALVGACLVLAGCDELPRCSVAGSRVNQSLSPRFREAVKPLGANISDIATFRLVDVKETASGKTTRSCEGTLNVVFQPGVWSKLRSFMAQPAATDTLLAQDLAAIRMADQLHPEKINNGNISLAYTFDVRPGSKKESDPDIPFEGPEANIYGDTLPMKIVEPYLRMGARALMPRQAQAASQQSNNTQATRSTLYERATAAARKPIDMMLAVGDIEPCGTELCVTLQSGSIVRLKSSSLATADRALLESAKASQGSICFRGTAVDASGEQSVAEGVAKSCS